MIQIYCGLKDIKVPDIVQVINGELNSQSIYMLCVEKGGI